MVYLLLSRKVSYVFVVCYSTKHTVENQSTQTLLGKCCHLVGHFSYSALIADGLMKKQKVPGFKKCFVLSKKYQQDGTALCIYYRDSHY